MSKNKLKTLSNAIKDTFSSIKPYISCKCKKIPTCAPFNI